MKSTGVHATDSEMQVVREMLDVETGVKNPKDVTLFVQDLAFLHGLPTLNYDLDLTTAEFLLT